jgi:hypothetical protein
MREAAAEAAGQGSLTAVQAEVVADQLASSALARMEALGRSIAHIIPEELAEEAQMVDQAVWAETLPARPH